MFAARKMFLVFVISNFTHQEISCLFCCISRLLFYLQFPVRFQKSC